MTTLVEELEQLIVSFKNYKPAQDDIRHLLDLKVTAFEDLLKLLDDSATDDHTQEIICWVLGRLNDSRSVSHLVKMLTHDNVGVRREATWSLGLIGDIKASAYLQQSLKNDTEVTVRMLSARSLGMIGDRTAAAMLVEKLHDETENNMLRGNIAEALGDLGGDEAVEALMVSAKDEDINIRFWSVFSLGKIADAKSLELLQDIAQNDESEHPEWGPVSDEAKRAIESIHE